MNAPEQITPQQAVRYYLQHSDSIDLASMLRTFATTEPNEFVDFICSITGKSPEQLSGMLAKATPSVFMQLAVHENRFYLGAREIVAFMKAGEKVPAIKKCREIWGLGLKESKDIIDVVHQDLIDMNLLPDIANRAVPEYDTLLPKQLDVLDEIRKAYHG